MLASQLLLSAQHERIAEQGGCRLPRDRRALAIRLTPSAGCTREFGEEQVLALAGQHFLHRLTADPQLARDVCLRDDLVHESAIIDILYVYISA